MNTDSNTVIDNTLLDNPDLAAFLTPKMTKYIRQVPWPKQLAFLLLDDVYEVFFGGSAGPGKALDVNTPIPTPTGWKNMGNLMEGDMVLSEQGTPCRVTKAFDVIQNPISFRMFFDDGSFIDCCKDHQWMTYSIKEMVQLTHLDPEWRERRRAKRPSRVKVGHKSEKFTASLTARNQSRVYSYKPAPTGTVRTTLEIFNTLRDPVRNRAGHAIPVSKPLDLPETYLPIPAYLMGAWLGDGTSCSAGFTSADQEIVERIRSLGWSVTKCHSHQYSYVIGDLESRPRIGGKGYGMARLFRVKLEQLGVLNNKHIPSRYLRGSYAQRLELLRGLMDTDGTVDKEGGGCEFGTTCYQLALDFYDLVVSMGWKTSMREGRAKLYGKDCGPKWTFIFTPSEIVFHLSRKANLQKLATRRTTKFRYIVNCQRIRPKPMRCISVDSPSHLFLAGKAMIPTHNSSALLMAALQFVDVPNYSAIILRKTFKDLSEPGAIMDRAQTWLRNTDAKWNDKEKTWTFPSRAKLVFGYMDGPLDHLNYQGAEFQYVGFDEASQLRWSQMQYMHSRIRRTTNIPVPLRIRYASNPGGVSHLELKTRFIDPNTREPGVVFIPARLEDNPSLNKEEYIENLRKIADPVTREQLLNGNWDISDGGQLFQRGWFRVVAEAPTGNSVKRVRFWDLAATEKSVGKDPDYTSGALVSIVDGMICIENIVRGRWRPQEVEKIVVLTAEKDGKKVPVRMEQEPGSAGVTVIDHYARKVLQGFDFKGIRSTGKKEEYAKPLSSAAEQGNVCLLGPARWHGPFLDEAEGFPFVPHDDQVDSVSKALAFLTGKKKRAGVW